MILPTQRQTTRGFTLIELMISLFLGLLLTAMVLPIFLSNIKAFETASAIARTQENARFALSEISKTIRNTGFRGCNINGNTIQNLTGNSAYNFSNGVFGYERSAAETIPGVEHSSITVKEATDAITLNNLFVINTNLSARAAPNATTLSVNQAGALTAGDVILLGDCESAVMLSVASIAGTTITLNETIPANKSFNTGSAVYQFESTTYFIAQSKLYINNRGAKPNALWRKVNGNASEELVAGIENLQMIYGIGSPGSDTPNQFVNATTVAGNFQNVALVRFKVEATSLEALGTQGVIRKPFNMTVSLRNRM